MEYSEIKKIMNDMEKSSLAELSLEFPDGTKISLKNVTEEKTKIISNPPAVNVACTSELNTEITTNKIKEIGESLKIVTSPMVGTFYAKPSPDAKNFVEIGTKVKKGETLCIIEAMKLMNEIESEYDGEIAEILVKDGEMVDYGKPLFKIK